MGALHSEGFGLVSIPLSLSGGGQPGATGSLHLSWGIQQDPDKLLWRFQAPLAYHN